jgi:hypothetical protein
MVTAVNDKIGCGLASQCRNEVLLEGPGSVLVCRYKWIPKKTEPLFIKRKQCSQCPNEHRECEYGLCSDLGRKRCLDDDLEMDGVCCAKSCINAAAQSVISDLEVRKIVVLKTFWRGTEAANGIDIRVYCRRLLFFH